MKKSRFKNYLLILGILILSSISVLAQPIIDNTMMTERWSEDFSNPNLSGWNIRTDCCLNCWQSPCNFRFATDMVSAPNGELLLKTERFTTPSLCSTVADGNQCAIEGPFTVPMKAAMVESIALFPSSINMDGNWMYYEIEAMMPQGNSDFNIWNSIWSSLWMGGSGGEIDLIEYYHTHFTMNSFVLSIDSSCTNSFNNIPDEFDGNYNKFAVLWNNDRSIDDDIYFFVNNKFVGTGIAPPDGISMIFKLDNKITHSSTQFTESITKVNNIKIYELTSLQLINDIDSYLLLNSCWAECQTENWLFSDNFELSSSVEIDECDGIVQLSDFNLDIKNTNLLKIELKNRWGVIKEPVSTTVNMPISPASYVYNQYKRTIDINYDLRFIHFITVYFELENECGPNQVLEYIIEIPPCDECCPEGFEYNGDKCYSGYHFSSEVSGFIANGNFYTTANSAVYPDNDHCPNGTTWDGTGCYYGPVPDNFNGALGYTSFYTYINCEVNCCPDGYVYEDGKCNSGITFELQKVFNAYELNGYFYTSKDCQKYLTNDCCPEGTYDDGVDCNYGKVPKGYIGFVEGNTFYVEPNCTVCCEENATFDGTNCINEIDHSITLPFDCYGDYYSEVNGVNNSLIFDGLDSNYRNKEDQIKIYPNPFVEGFTIDCSAYLEAIQKISIYSLSGKYIKVILKGDIKAKIEISDIEESGLYIVNIITNTESKTYKVINLK